MFLADRGKDGVIVERLIRAEFDVKELCHRVSNYAGARPETGRKSLPGTEAS